MHAEELKLKLREILGEQIEFNKEFDKYAETIKNIDDNLMNWCKFVKEGKLRANRAPRREEVMVFIKKIGSSNRCIVLKIKNGEFKEVHLGDHAYYDKLRKELGLKSDSKYY